MLISIYLQYIARDWWVYCHMYDTWTK